MKDLSIKIQTARATNIKEKVKNCSVFLSGYDYIAVDTDNWTAENKQHEPMFTFRIDGQQTTRMTERDLIKALQNYFIH